MVTGGNILSRRTKWWDVIFVFTLSEDLAMKCKMPGSKPAEPATYLCMNCDSAFKYGACADEELFCRKCGTDDMSFLIPIYVENNIQEQAMYCPIDWHGG